MSKLEDMIIRDVLAGLHAENLSPYNKFLSIESAIGEHLGDDFTPKNISFNCPHSKSVLKIKTDEFGALSFELKTENQTFQLKSELPQRKIHEEWTRMQETIERERIGLGPAYDKDFVKILKSAVPGQIISLSPNFQVICEQDKTGETYFKERFSGNLASLTLEAFTMANTYSLSKSEDIQYMYSKGYSYISHGIDYSILDNNREGYNIMREAELKAMPGTTLYHIGAIELRCLNDGHGNRTWFDSKGTTIDRKDIETMFSWAKGSTAIIGKARYFDQSRISPTYTTISEQKFFEEIKRNALSHKFKDLVSNAFEYSKSTGGYSSIMMSGLSQAKNEIDFDLRSYAFLEIGDTRKIWEIRYVDNDIKKGPETVVEITEDEFARFCEEKYKEPFKSIKTKDERFLPKNEQAEIIMQMAKDGTNPLDVSDAQINALDENVTSLLKSYTKNLESIKEQIEENRHKFISTKEINRDNIRGS